MLNRLHHVTRPCVRVAVIAAALLSVDGAASIAGLPSSVAPAAAQEPIIEKPGAGVGAKVELNIHLSYYYQGFLYNVPVGPGIDMLFPVVKNGFISGLNNHFYIGFFADTLFHLGAGSFLSLAAGPYAQWRFAFLKMFDSGELSAFANVGGGVWLGFPGAFGQCYPIYYAFGASCSDVIVSGFPLFQVGGNLFFTKNIGLRVKFGWPSTDVGLNIAF